MLYPTNHINVNKPFIICVPVSRHHQNASLHFCVKGLSSMLCSRIEYLICWTNSYLSVFHENVSPSQPSHIPTIRPPPSWACPLSWHPDHQPSAALKWIIGWHPRGPNSTIQAETCSKIWKEQRIFTQSVFSPLADIVAV